MTALYTRVSTESQAEEGYSLEEQAERLTNYCAALGWTDTRLYTDAGFSGGNTDRPALRELMRDVERGKVERVVVYKLDRLSRSQKDTLFLIEDVFLAHGCDFVSMTENLDTGAPLGKAMIGILAVFAQLEREQIRERLKVGLDARAKLGKFHGSAQVPIGYDYKDGELVTNEFEKMQVVRIFEEYAAGKTPPKITDDLNAEGLTQKGKPWLVYTVRQILKKKTYLGYTFYRGEWYKGNHEAFISEELFERVQKRREGIAEEHAKHNRNSGKAASYLAGFVYCGECGAKYVHIRHFYKGEPRYLLYGCVNRSHKANKAYNYAPHCRGKYWKEPELDALIFGEIKKLAVDPAYFEKTAAADDKKEAVLTAQRREIDAKLSRLMDLYTDGEIPKKSLTERVHALNDQREKIDAELVRLSEEKKEKTARADALPLVRSFADAIERGTFEEIRAILSALIDKIVIDGDDVRIFWKF